MQNITCKFSFMSSELKKKTNSSSFSKKISRKGWVLSLPAFINEFSKKKNSTLGVKFENTIIQVSGRLAEGMSLKLVYSGGTVEVGSCSLN